MCRDSSTFLYPALSGQNLFGRRLTQSYNRSDVSVILLFDIRVVIALARPASGNCHGHSPFTIVTVKVMIECLLSFGNINYGATTFFFLLLFFRFGSI